MNMSTRIETRANPFPKLPFDRRNLVFVGICSFLAGVVAIIAAQNYLALPGRYEDFTVGETSWSSSSKFRDLASFPAFVAGFIMVGWVMFRYFSHLSRSGGREYEAEVNRELSWWLLPVAAGLSGMMSPNPTDLLFMFPVGIVGISTLLSFAGANLGHRRIPTSELTLGLIAALFFSLLPAALFGLAGNLTTGISMPGFSGGLKVMLGLHVATVTALSLIIRYRPGMYRSRLGEMILISQSGLALLYSLLIPNVFFSNDFKRAIPMREWLPALSVALAIITWVDLRKRWVRHKAAPQGGYPSLFSPWAVFTLILLFKSGQSIPPMIPTDDQRFGEGLLGWWSLREFGMIPHIDYLPRHGIFGDYFTGFVSWLFLDGTAGTLMEANRLAMAIVSLAAFFSLLGITRHLLLSFVAVLFFSTNHYQQSTLNFLILTPFISAMLAHPPDKDANRWLKLWPLLVIAMIWIAPALGIAMAAASLPALSHHAAKARPEKVEKYKWVILGFLVLATALSPLPAMMTGAIRQAWEEWRVFQVAFGTEWTTGYSELSEKGGGLLERILLDFFRMSWVWVLLFSVLVLILFIGRREHRSYLLNLVLPVILLILFLSPYAMGRIEHPVHSAAGTLSGFSLSILLPLLVSPWLNGRRALYPALVIVFLSSGIGNHSVGVNGLAGALERKTSETRADAASLGLFNIGRASMQKDHSERLNRVNKVIRRFLAYREPYLDLTGNQAHYMYFDRPPAMSTPSPVHLVTTDRQSRELARLTKNPPKLILLEADNPFGAEGKIALRSHLLYRFVLSRYYAELHDGYVFGLPKSLHRSQGNLVFTLSGLTDSLWNHGVHKSGRGLMARDSLTTSFLRPGDKIVLPDGSRHEIKSVSASERTLWLANPVKNKALLDEKSIIPVVLDSIRRTEISKVLMTRVFTHEDLGQVPVTWGRSYTSLRKRMSPVASLDLSNARLHNMAPSNGWHMVTGDNPWLEASLAGLQISGRKAGLLYLEFECKEGREHDCLFSVIWWRKGEKEPEKGKSLSFKAQSGRLIVPLDSHPDWLMAENLGGIRIELPDSMHCKNLRLSNASLHQRLMGGEPYEEPLDIGTASVSTRMKKKQPSAD
jgi:hypothetical protein